MGQDTKHYTLLNDGTYAVSKAEWDADDEKLATDFADGVGLKVYTEGDYEAGCIYGFARGGHWYVY